MSVKRRRKGTDGLIERIGDLERRIRELEARPPQIVTAPVYVQPPVYVPAPYVPPNYPWITCGSDGLFAGKLPRARHAWIPHYSALIAGTTPAAAPASLDYTKGLPTELGEMLNNAEGDCAEAAYGQFLQIDSFLATG